MHGLQFRSFKKSASFNPETGEETKIVEQEEDIQRKKDLLDEILEKENRVGVSVDLQDKQKNVTESNNDYLERTTKDESESIHASTMQVTRSSEMDSTGESKMQYSEALHINPDTNYHDAKLSVPQKIEEFTTSEIEDDMINDKYETLPLYQRLQKRSLEEDEELDEKFDIEDDVRQYLPSALSSEDIQFYEALKRSSDTRMRDKLLNDHLKEKVRKQVFSLEDKKRKHEELNELLHANKRARQDINIDIDEVLVVEDGVGRMSKRDMHQAGTHAEEETHTVVENASDELQKLQGKSLHTSMESNNPEADTNNEILHLFSGYSSD